MPAKFVLSSPELPLVSWVLVATLGALHLQYGHGHMISAMIKRAIGTLGERAP